MAKDPAFLFYPGDWLGGTMGMTYEEKGAYLELLVMQWNCHRITNDVAKRMLGNELWQKISHKFSKDANGFFNKRLEEEIQKRRKHSEKQRDNANKRWKKDVCDGIANAMPLENENENINEDVFMDRGVGKGWNVNPGEDEIDLELPDVKAGAVTELFGIAKNHTLTKKELDGLWSIFKRQNFTGVKYYQSVNDVYSHFINWCKNQNINGSTTHRGNSTTGAKAGTSSSRIEKAKNW